MKLALTLVAEAPVGAFIYLDDEGRGLGLFEKALTMNAMAAGADTVEAFIARGLPADARTYAAVPKILDLLGVGQTIRLLTNNPAKIAAAESGGRQAIRVALEVAPTEFTRRYL